MRLLKWNDGNVCLIDFADKPPPPYAILSHTWGPAETEVTYGDLRNNTAKAKRGYNKIRFCGIQARRDQLDHFWIDTCCIDKDSSAELQESLNSMFKWYENSRQCYVYLSDVSKAEQQPSAAPATTSWETAFRKSKWFTRGWTLQELIAPKSVTFFSKEDEYLGDKKNLESLIHDITTIPVEALRGSRPLSEFSDNDRFAWMEKRKTTRSEDEVYALLGIFDVFVPLMYGQGREKVLNKLKEEIERDRIRKISITNADNYLRDDYYSDTRLRIERLSGKRLDMEHCYINLAIIERTPEKPTRSEEGYSSRKPSPFELFSRLKVNEPTQDVKVKLSELFDSRQNSDGRTKSSRRILIRGRAGVGKTTLCTKMVFSFKRGDLWGHLFDRILWIPLRSLKTWTSDHCNFREFLYLHFYHHHPFGQDLAERLERAIGTNKQHGENSRTLFILDGLDEVSQTWNPGEPKHEFLVKLLNQPNVIITSRPHAQIPQDADRPIDLELETIGFYPDQVNDYLKMAFQNTDEVNKVQDVLGKYPIIQGLVRIPILLDAFCYTWDTFGPSGSYATPQTMTTLYQAIIENLLRKDIVRLEKSHEGQVVTSAVAAALLPFQLNQTAKMELHLLENLAFMGMVHDMIDFEPRIRNIILRTAGSRDGIMLPDHTLRHLSFLRTSDPHQESQDVSYHFLHLTFQEFFAARYFVRQWISGGNLDLKNAGLEAADSRTMHPTIFLTQFKYEPRYDIFWRFVAGLLQDVDARQNIRFFQIIQDPQSRDLLGPAHQRLIMHCLGEVSAQNELRTDLETTLEQWLVFELELTGSSHLATATEFPDRIFLNVFKNREKAIVKALLSTLKNRLSLPKNLLALVLARLEDPDDSVRWVAADALRSRTDDPQVRQALLARLEDPDGFVRWAAADALRSQTGDPQVRQALLARLEDADGFVRWTVADALGSRTGDPQVRQALLARLEDPDDTVRWAVARALGSRTGDPQVRQALLARLEDADGFVRGAAAHALGGRTDDPQVRQALLARLEDPDDTVRSAAAEAFLQYKHGNFDLSNKSFTQTLYSILFEMSFKAQFSWQILSGVSYLITPWGVREICNKDVKKLAKLIKQAQPSKYPSDVSRKEKRWFNLSRDKISLIGSRWHVNK